MIARRWIAVGSLGAGGVAVVAVIAVAGSGGAAAAANGDTAVQTATTKIERRDLVEVEEVDGTLGYSDARTVTNRLDGTVTWLPAAGATVRRNHRLYEVDGKAVYLLDGATPAWRTLKRGTSGDDVRELERNLRALGLDRDGAMDVDGEWDAGTTAAVKRWQARKGLAETGQLELGRVVFQPGTRRVAATSATLGGSAGQSAAGASGGTAAPQGASFKAGPRAATTDAVWDGQSADVVPTTYADFDGSATHLLSIGTRQTGPTGATTGAAPSAKGPTGATGPTQPAGPGASPATGATAGTAPATQGAAPATGGRPSGGASAPAAGGAPSSGAPSSGDAATAAATPATANALLTTTSVRKIVAVRLKTSKAELARRGESVTVELPSGDDVKGRIASVGTVATAATGENASASDATIRVTLKLHGAAATGGLDQAPVTVRLEQSRRKDVLAVPVTALQAVEGGGFAVELRDGGQRRVLPVRVGLYTSGYVEVSGAGLRAGLPVSNAGV